MGRRSVVALVSSTFLMAGCTIEAASGPDGVDPADIKPADASELAGSRVGSAQQGHTFHYVDGTNQWGETNYPMGTDNPNCKDWWIYDRYLSLAPAVGWSEYYHWQTNHAYITGAYINQWQATIPDNLGYSDAWREIMIFKSSVVARANGKCSGRYVFQWDNHTSAGTNNFMANAYWVTAMIPPNYIPGEAACKATGPTGIPHTFVDLYVCEANTGTNIGSFTNWCGANSSNWRKVGSANSAGWWNSVYSRCDTGTGVYYSAPSGKVAVSFNFVIKTGIGHGVTPFTVQLYRYY
jgi:hypothetical protein